MIYIHARLLAGLIVVAFAVWFYRAAMELAAVNRRERRNGSSGGVVRAIKSHAFIVGLIGFVLARSWWVSYSYYRDRGVEWMGDARALLIDSALTFSSVAFLLVLDLVLQEIARKHNAEKKMHEAEHERRQKRATDPVPGAPLEPES